MLGTAIVAFREVPRGLTIVGIVLVAGSDAPGRGRWVSCGIAEGSWRRSRRALPPPTLPRPSPGRPGVVRGSDLAARRPGARLAHYPDVSPRSRVRGRRRPSAEPSSQARARSMLWPSCGAAVLREGSEPVAFLYGSAARVRSEAHGERHCHWGGGSRVWSIAHPAAPAVRGHQLAGAAACGGEGGASPPAPNPTPYDRAERAPRDRVVPLCTH